MEDNLPRDFIRQAIDADRAKGANAGRVVTRFPPEPNGYLHIGHAKSICLNFTVAAEFGGRCFLRFDDTNPEKEDALYVEAIKEDVRWLGFDWGESLTHASDYFKTLFESAQKLIEAGKAYVDSLSAEETRSYRGTLTEPGTDSPFRSRSVTENLDLFRRMAVGEFDEGAHVLRAKIDMAAGNMNLRDPALYRIRKAHHQRTGDRWCIYPMYDFAHTLSDALEGTTHSLCTLEFEDHRPLYNWLLEQLAVIDPPRQIEFSRLNLMFTLTSKRALKRLIDEGHVHSWDDPRMPTLAALRRRGYTPASIRDFCTRVGITKKENTIELGALENCLREDLNENAERRVAVLDPIKVVIENFPEGETETLMAANHPNRPELGSREVTFSRELWIERNDFMEDPPRKFFRLKPGGEVRLRYGYIIKCEEVVKDSAGEIDYLRCTMDPATRSGSGPEAQRKVKGTIHWLSAATAQPAVVNLYDRLFKVPNPTTDLDLAEQLNPDSLIVRDGAYIEPALIELAPATPVQFERLGYFVLDSESGSDGRPCFNRAVTLRDSWAKLERQLLAQG
jgi:glutaminyl-tRNA synthetase